MLKQIMTLQPQELPRGRVSPLPHELGHGNPAVVIAAPAGHAAEELKSSLMAGLGSDFSGKPALHGRSEI